MVAMLDYIPYHLDIAGYQVGFAHLFLLAAVINYITIGIIATVIQL